MGIKGIVPALKVVDSNLPIGETFVSLDGTKLKVNEHNGCGCGKCHFLNQKQECIDAYYNGIPKHRPLCCASSRADGKYVTFEPVQD